MEFVLNEQGLDRTIKFLQDYSKTFRDYNDFLVREVEPELKNLFKRVFATDGFGKWPRLKQSTLDAKAAAGRTSEPLEFTGRYRRACENLAGKRVGRNNIQIVSPIREAVYQEFGTGNIPARPVFELVAERMRRSIRRLYTRYNARQTR